MRPLASWLNSIRTSFWFLPAVMAALAAVAARLLLAVDLSVPLWGARASSSSATSLLSTLAGSLITVTGVVFSLTLVTLHLASTQFGPRLLRSFMRDRWNQATLGTFVATFVFCLVALVGRPPPTGASVAGALVLTAASVGVLIYFIHHMATAIQADSVVANVAGQLTDQLDRVYPRDEKPPSADIPQGPPGSVRAQKEGYVTSLDLESLLAAADDAAAHLQCAAGVGTFVLEGDVLLRGWPPQAATPSLHRHVSIQPTRTEEGDVEFNVQQLTEMAVRALSPGINDPYSAIACIDRLTSAYCRLAGRRDDQRAHTKGDGVVFMPRPTFDELLRAGFGTIRPHARSVEVQVSLFDALARLGQCSMRDARRRAVQNELEALTRFATSLDPPRLDLDLLQERHNAALQAIAAGPAATGSPAPDVLARR